MAEKKAETKEIEALKTALLLEKQGEIFYQRVAKDAGSRAVANLFEIMAEEEAKHIEYLGKQFAHYSAAGAFLEQEPEEAAQSAVRKIMSKEICQQISVASYEAAAISAAIEMENRAIKIYSDRAEASKDATEQQLYSWLARWEKGHLKFLAKINDELAEEIWYENDFWPF